MGLFSKVNGAFSQKAQPMDYIKIPLEISCDIASSLYKIASSVVGFAYHTLLSQCTKGKDRRDHQFMANAKQLDINVDTHLMLGKKVERAANRVNLLARGQKESKVESGIINFGFSALQSAFNFPIKAFKLFK